MRIVMGRTVAAEATDTSQVVTNIVTTDTTSWRPEPHDVPAELTEDFHPEPFTPPETISERMSGVSVADRLDDTMRHRLTELGYL